MWKQRTSEGFTLVELMVVVMIIGILAAVVIPRFVNSTITARENAARVQVKQLATAIDLYQLEMKELPRDLKDLVVDPGEDGWNGPYLKERAIPEDPWGNRYVYRAEGTRGVDYDVYSLGPDKADETGDDIGNWPPEKDSDLES